MLNSHASIRAPSVPENFVSLKQDDERRILVELQVPLFGVGRQSSKLRKCNLDKNLIVRTESAVFPASDTFAMRPWL